MWATHIGVNFNLLVYRKSKQRAPPNYCFKIHSVRDTKIMILSRFEINSCRKPGPLDQGAVWRLVCQSALNSPLHFIKCSFLVCSWRFKQLRNGGNICKSEILNLKKSYVLLRGQLFMWALSFNESISKYAKSGNFTIRKL